MAARPGVAFAAGITSPPAPAGGGAPLYARYCALCHGAHAEGYAADNAPSLVSATFSATATDEFLRAAIERGRPGTAMGGFGRSVGGPLSPQEIDALLAFLRGRPTQKVLLPATPVVGDAVKGKAEFYNQCALCHGTPAQRADSVHLANGYLLNGASDAFLRYAIVNGRPGTRMEAWGKRLDAATIDNLVAYLRSLAPPTMPPLPPPGFEAPLPRQGPIVLNPKGKAPELTLREDRFAPLAQVKEALDQKRRIVIVDARPPSDWLRLHIPGSISVPFYDLKSLDDLPNDGTWIIAYCACPHHASGVVVDELRKRNYKHTAVLDEGVFAWQHAGYPVVAAAGALPVPAPPILQAARAAQPIVVPAAAPMVAAPPAAKK